MRESFRSSTGFGVWSGGLITERDLIFISYAVEDVVFADWLALKLTSAGYRVYYDRMSLLAGRSWVKEVDDAIGKRAFRVLGLLSKSSKDKPKPTGERTKAQNVGTALGIEGFLIPLNVDGLPASELPWTVTQDSYIPFNQSWADGLNQLLKTLAALQAPRDEALGRELVCQWASAEDQAVRKQERVWTNVLPVLSVPTALRQYEVHDPDKVSSLKERWPCAVAGNALVWAFEEPPADLASEVTFSRAVAWADFSGEAGLKLRNAATYLLRRAIKDYCIKNGLKLSHENRLLYFPSGVLKDDKQFFTGLYGKRTYVKVVGQATFRVLGEKEINNHHLAPNFSLVSHTDGSFSIRVVNRLFLTTQDGTPIHPSRMNRRRKKICKNWWNDKWGSRLLAVTSWFSQGTETVELIKSPGGTFSVAGNPLSLTALYGINEGDDTESAEGEESCTPEIDDHEASNTIADYSDEVEKEDSV